MVVLPTFWAGSGKFRNSIPTIPAPVPTSVPVPVVELELIENLNYCLLVISAYRMCNSTSYV